MFFIKPLSLPSSSLYTRWDMAASLHPCGCTLNYLCWELKRQEIILSTNTINFVSFYCSCVSRETGRITPSPLLSPIPPMWLGVSLYNISSSFIHMQQLSSWNALSNITVWVLEGFCFINSSIAAILAEGVWNKFRLIWIIYNCITALSVTWVTLIGKYGFV